MNDLTTKTSSDVAVINTQRIARKTRDLADVGFFSPKADKVAAAELESQALKTLTNVAQVDMSSQEELALAVLKSKHMEAISSLGIEAGKREHQLEEKKNQAVTEILKRTDFSELGAKNELIQSLHQQFEAGLLTEADFHSRVAQISEDIDRVSALKRQNQNRTITSVMSIGSIRSES